MQLCLLMTAVLALPANGEPANLVQNPGFEEADNTGRPVTWRCSPQVYQLDSEVKHSGDYSLRFHNTDPGRYELCTQSIPLEHGRMYEFSVWVKTQGLHGEDTGATICLEWWGKDNKYLGGSYPAGVKGDTDWRLIRAISSRIPPEAERCGVVVYCRRGMTGTAWFDDVQVKRAFANPMDAVLLRPNYRGILWPDQPPHMVALVGLDIRDLECTYDDLLVHLKVADAAGRQWAETSARPAGAEFEVRLGLPDDLPHGEYEASLELAMRSTGRVLATTRHRLIRPAADAPKPAVFIDQHNRIILDGKPFFPLGTYWNTGLMKDETLRLYSESAFNCLMPYGTPSREQMDLAHKYGLKVIYSIKDAYAGTQWCPKEIDSPEKERPWIERQVTAFRDHPALLAWYLNDELPLTMLDRLTAHQQWLEELDPNHPTWVVLYQVRDVRKYMPTFDVIGTDPYPIPGHPSRAAEWARLTVQGVAGARPVWMVPQIFNWNCYNKDRGGRTPTYEEMRSMAWQCICNGANGLVFYSFFDIRRDPQTPFDVQWERVKRVAEEIARWTPALLSVDKPAPVEARGTHVHWLAKSLNGKTYVFAVNDDYEPHSVTFQLPSWAAGLRRLSDEALLAANGRDRTSDKLAGLDMQVYEIVSE